MTYINLKVSPFAILISPMHSQPEQQAHRSPTYAKYSLETRQQLVQQTLRQGRGGLKRAARRLGVNQQTAKAIWGKYRRTGTYYKPKCALSAQGIQSNHRTNSEASSIEQSARPPTLEQEERPVEQTTQVCPFYQTIGVTWVPTCLSYPVFYQPIGFTQSQGPYPIPQEHVNQSDMSTNE